MSTRKKGPSQWLVNRRHEREQIMSDKSHSAFDASPPPPNDNEEASDAGEMRKGSILVIESDTEHEESSSSESELVEGRGSIFSS